MRPCSCCPCVSVRLPLSPVPQSLPQITTMLSTMCVRARACVCVCMQKTLDELEGPTWVIHVHDDNDDNGDDDASGTAGDAGGERSVDERSAVTPSAIARSSKERTGSQEESAEGDEGGRTLVGGDDEAGHTGEEKNRKKGGCCVVM